MPDAKHPTNPAFIGVDEQYREYSDPSDAPVDEAPLSRVAQEVKAFEADPANHKEQVIPLGTAWLAEEAQTEEVDLTPEED